MKYIQLVTSTVTYANKGRDVLKQYGIKSDVKKVQGTTAAGCLFGIVVFETDEQRAKDLLSDNGIKIVAVRELKA